MRKGLIFLVLAITFWVGFSVTAPAQQTSEEASPLTTTVAVAPIVFETDGQRHLCYELYLTNMYPTPWTLQSIAVSDTNGKTVLTVESNDLSKVLLHPGVSRDDPGYTSASIGAGETVIAFLWVDLPNGTPAPSRLTHRFITRRSGGDKDLAFDGAETEVRQKTIKIASPLRGKDWSAGNGPSNTSAHRRAVQVINGKTYLSQRYAIDWVQLGGDNKTYTGDAKDNNNYHCFGKEALAIADATVVDIKDGIPENTPDETVRAVPITLETVSGNRVILDLGGGVYAMYAHLQPGSLRVSTGNHIKAGQVLGLVGNTGNSSEPHLHFQLMDQPSPLASEGLPYQLPSYIVTGHGTVEGNAPVVKKLTPPQTYRNQMPKEDDVVDF